MLTQESLHHERSREKKLGRVLVCAWCRARLEPAPPAGEVLENFGICRSCMNEQLSRASRPAGALE